MAHIVEEGAEGAETGIAKKAVTINEWLETNRLGKLKGYFEAEEIAMEDLLMFTESEIKLRVSCTTSLSNTWEYRTPHINVRNTIRSAIWNEKEVVAMKPGPLYRSKFMKAWRKLKPDAASPATTGAAPTREIIVISTKEETAMQKMKDALSNIAQSLEQNAADQAKLTADTQRISSQIESTFSEYVAKLTERAMALQEQLRTESKQRTEALKQQQENLQKLKGSVESGLESQNAMLIDTKMDRKKREIKIEEITTKLLSAMDDNTKVTMAADMVFATDDNAVVVFVSSIGSLSKRPDPPTLNVSEISQTAATIRFESKFDSVIYSFRYRRETGDDDDEKENQWTEQVLDNGLDQFILNGLQRKSKYELRSFYKLVGNMVPSALSDIVSFQTLDSPAFEWDPARKSNSITLSNDNRTLQSTRGGWKTVVSKTKVTMGSLKGLDWEVTMVKIPNYAHHMIGFVDVNSVNQVGMDSLPASTGGKEQCAFYMNSGCFSRYEYGSHHNFDSKWRGENCKNGNRILFRFRGSVCTVYLNDSEVGILKENVPSEIYFFATPYVQETLETTKFITIPKA